MAMDKIFAIAYKDIYATFTDRSLLVLMLVTPLVIATIIALAFSDVLDEDGPIRDVPVAIVNLDTGDNGQIFVDVLMPANAEATDAESPFAQCPDTEETTEQDDGFLQDLTAPTLLTDPTAARSGVDDGTYVAAIIIPEDFSERITFSPQNLEIDPVPVEVYGDSSRSISASVIRTVTESITTQILAGQISIAATYQTLFTQGLAAQSAEVDPCAFTLAFDPGNNAIGVDQQSLGEAEDETAGSLTLLAIFGSSQAAFFALFTASGTAATILEERRDGTLQRMLVTPTPRSHILFAKLLAVVANVLLQLVLLFIAFTVVGSLLEGEWVMIWGTNMLAIVALVLAMALAAGGVGTIIASVAHNAEQANIVGSVVALFMGAAGGAFFSIGELPPLFETITRLSIVRWGSEGFTELAEGSSAILPNLVALSAIGTVLFFLSLLLFNRRADV